MAPKQGELTGVLGPLKPYQEAALDYAEKLDQVDRLKQAADKAKEAMIKSAHKHHQTRIVVRDSENREHVFEIEAGDIKVRHKSYTVVVEEKAEASA